MSIVLERRSDLTDPTPMMQQYLDVKEQYADYILMYRLGDFFECFFEDAVTVSRELELTLTGRDCGEGRRAAMCGVPFHKADLYIGKLIERGHKVAVCEQTEDPAQAEGLVKREVIRVVTPGTVTDGTLLNDSRNNYLGALCYAATGVGLAFADISTGQVLTTFIGGDNVNVRLKNELGTYLPREVLCNIPMKSAPEIGEYLLHTIDALVSDGEERLFDAAKAHASASACFGDALSEIKDDACLCAVGALLGYIRQTQMCDPSFVRELHVYSDGQYMELDQNTRRNLELVESMRTKEKKGSLLWVLDRTETAMGARLLRSWVLKPLLSPVAISHRQAAVTDFYNDYMVREETRAALSGILDLERLTAKAVYGTANAKDLRAICQSISPLPALKKTLLSCKGERMRELASGLDTLEDLYDLLDRSLVETPPYTVREAGMIREGYNDDVDYLRNIQNNGEEWKNQIQEREREATGIKTLSVGYNKVFGYYIEVTKSLTPQVPDRYIRKQTLTNCERYITQELKEMESTILGAQDKLCALEFQLFCEIRDAVAAASDRIQKTAALIAETDVYASFADVATEYNYVCPEVDLSETLTVREGRHPVVERFAEDACFVPNDTELDTGAHRLMLITGPNMAGKSTYMRQVALIAVMAQIGSYVPARAAKLGIIDKVFTRVGASDDLASGQSTFMLEMTEVAHILKTATRRSLIVYDEVGRGTSTFDGMSIARAVAEYTLGKKIGAKTLFATHYHELTSMEEEFEGVVNYNVAAKKRGDTVTFLRRIVRGATDDSYGIDVAKLAGVPNEVVSRAREILSAIESGTELPTPKRNIAPPPAAAPAATDMFALLERSEAEEVADKLRAVDLNTMTPIEAMNLIYECKKRLSAEN